MGLLRQTRKTLRRAGYRLSCARKAVTTGERPPRIAFIHTPKTGGTSINSYFKEYVGSKRSGRIVFYDDFSQLPLNVFAEQARKARFVTGHMPWTAFESFRDESTYSLTFLRDPYDRLRSLYQYVAHLPPSVRDDNDVRLVKTMSLKEFLVSRHPVVVSGADNFVARQFAGSLGYIPKSREERLSLAEAAIHNLSTVDLIGFNDNFDSAFLEVADIAGLPQPPAGRKMNVTASFVRSAEKKSEAMRSFDDEMRDLARPLVEADLIVYEHFRRLSNLP
ncbi:MAG: hypothetical protein ABJL17_08075 [Parvibaculum sp.]|uniref:hypothetical protein n=1 Tax=Parvibaculum sp. TaxID=2024848 RepID=UPI0032639EFF